MVNKDADQERLLGGSPLEGMQGRMPPVFSETYEAHRKYAATPTRDTSQKIIEGKTSSAVYIHQDPSSYLSQRLRRARSDLQEANPPPYVSLSRANETANSERQKLALHGSYTYKFGNPWSNMQDSREDAGPGSNVDDCLNQQFTSSVSLLSGELVRGNHIRKGDEIQSPSKKRKLDGLSIDGGALYLARG